MALNNNNMNEPQRTIGLKLGLISFSLIVALLVVGVLSVNALMALKQNVNDIVDVSILGSRRNEHTVGGSKASEMNGRVLC